MNTSTRTMTVLMVWALLALPLLGDTLTLRSGDRILGHFESANSRVVNFRMPSGEIRSYDILNIDQIQFDNNEFPGPPVSSSEYRGSDRQENSSASDTYRIPAGSKIIIRMTDSVNSEKQKIGDEFRATLDEPIVLEGVSVVPKDVEVRGRIADVHEAGRLAGSAELGLELTQLRLNGISYSLATSEYAEATESRTGETITRAGIGAGIGGIIGAIAGGAKGAAIGAGVGAGGATAVQVLTKGEKINIPSETRLEFTLQAPLVIPRP